MLYVVISDAKLHFFDDISKENNTFSTLRYVKAHTFSMISYEYNIQRAPSPPKTIVCPLFKNQDSVSDGRTERYLRLLLVLFK